MTNLLGPDGMVGCFRCAYVWRPRSTTPPRCPRCKSVLWDVPKLHAMGQGRGLGIRDVVLPNRKPLMAALRASKARNPRVFGSVARSEASKSSDLDLLVDFDEGATVFDHVTLIIVLQKIFNRRVDVTEPTGLHWLVRPQVLFEAIPV